MEVAIKPDPSLHTYIEILQRETKFKAKVIYTLSCIQNVLSSSPLTYQANIEYLSKFQNVFGSVVSLYGDSSVLEPLAEIFYRFEVSGINGACKEFLGYFEKAKIAGETSDRLIEYVCKMLNLLKHRYPNTKPICLKLLDNGEKKLTEGQTKVVLETMTNSSAITKEEFKYLGEFSKINIPPTKFLELMWRSGLKTNGKKAAFASQKEEGELDAINGCLAEGWRDEAIKYACVRVCLWNSTSSSGVVEKMSPDYVDGYLKKSLKCFYPVEKTDLNIDISKCFKEVIQHCSNEYHNQSLSSQIALILPHFKTNKDYTEVLTNIQEREEISRENQIKYCLVIDEEFLSNEEAMLSKLQSNPKPSSAFKILKKLENINFDISNEVMLKICLLIVQIYLCNKNKKYLKEIEWILSSKLRGSVKKYISLLEQRIEYILLSPFVIKSMKELNSKQKLIFHKSFDIFMANEAIKIEYKFCLAAKMIKLQEEKCVRKFINYLLTKLNKEELLYEEILFYMKNCEGIEKDGLWLYENFEEDMERILEKVFGKLVTFDFKAAKQIIFALQKFEIFDQWLPIYRWTLNPLDDPNFDNPEGLIDSFEVFETMIENCKSVPLEIIKKFFEIISKFWQDFNHQHMFTIERIAEALFSGQEMEANSIEELSSYFKKLMQREWKLSNPEIYRLSLSLLLTNTIMEESEEIEDSLTKIIFKQIASTDEKCLENDSETKTLIFAQEIVMWRFQYEEITIHQKVGEALFRILNTHDEFKISNEKDREMLVQNSLEIVSSIGHECNLLELKLVKIMRNFFHNKNIVSFALDVLINVKEVNARAIAKFELEKIIPQILVTLILSEDEELNKVYVDFLKEICLEETPYKAVIEKNKNLVLEILRAETVFVNEKHCDEIANFVILFFKSIPKEQINESLLSNLWLKYYTNEMVRNYCEEVQPSIAETKNSHIYLIEYENIGAAEPEADEEEDIEVSNEEIVMLEKKHIYEDSEKKLFKSEERNFNSQSPQEKTKPKVPIEMKMEIDDELETNTPPHPSASLGRKKDKDEQMVGFEGVKVPKVNSAESPKRKKNPAEKQKEMERVKDIKSHIEYIGKCANQELNEESLTMLRESLKYLINVVGLNPLYCQKVVISGAMNKCLSLHSSVQKTELNLILDLIEEIAENNEKNLIVFIVFNGAKSIDFLKSALNSSIESRKDKSSNEKVINIIHRCWNSSCNDFLSNGLLGTLFEMVKMNISRGNILEMLSKNDLSEKIADEIYQRDLFNVMENIYKTSPDSAEEKLEIIQWAKLIGKITLTQSVREKLYSINLHELAYAKLTIFQELSSVNSLAYMFANFTKEFDQMAAWLLQNKIPEEFFREMGKEKSNISQDYFLFFKSFLENGKEYLNNLFNIKLHIQMIELMKEDRFKISNECFDSFFDTLSHFFTPENYQMFLKEEIVALLLKKYFSSHNNNIMQCLESLVEQIQDRKDAEMLEKQGFYTVSKALNHDVKDDMSYHHVIQMYITLLRKFKNINPKEMNFYLITKAVRKSRLSANLEGQKKTIELINELSELDKVSYGYVRCYQLFESILSYSFGYEEVCLFFNYLILESKYAVSERLEEEKNKELGQNYLGWKKVTDVTHQHFIEILPNKYLEFKNKLEKNEGNNEENEKCVDKMVAILMMFVRNKTNLNMVFEKIKFRIFTADFFSLPYYFESSLDILCEFSSDKYINECIRNFPDWDILKYMKELHLYIEDIQDTSKKENLICGFKRLLLISIQNNLCNRLALIEFIEDKIKTSSYKANPNIQEFLSQYEALETQEKIVDKMPDKMNDRMNDKMTEKMTEKIKETVRKGIKVKMYKIDGSNSSLILFFTSDLLELNCVVSLGEPVKAKWRLPLSQINGVEEFENNELFKKSVFYLSEGIFTKPPQMENCLTLQGKEKQFCICFEGKQQLKEWKNYIEMGIERAIDLMG